MRTTDVAGETGNAESASLAVRQLKLLEQSDLTALLTRPDIAQAIRHATAKVVESDFDRYEGLRGVMVGRAYSIAYQALGTYDEEDGALLGWLSQKVQAGLRTDFA